MRHILICEDEIQIVSFLQKELEHEGYKVCVAYDGAGGLELFNSREFDLVLLDIMLPVKNGLEVLREIRRKSRVPVVMLTARKDVYDKVALLDAGADDYITKPFDTTELLARIRSVLRRADGSESKTETELLSVDEPGCRVMANGLAVPLTRTEFDIFLYLYRSAGRVKTRDQILTAVYGEYFGESNNVDVNVKNIRKKLLACGMDGVIETVRGRGYVLR